MHAYVSTRPGSRILYASKTLLLTLRTSALASVAVNLIAFSTSFARASFSRSGGLKDRTHARTLSNAMRRRVTDLSRRGSTKYGKSEMSCVWSMMVCRAALAREMTTLFGREQMDRRVGTNRGTSGSKEGPSSVARVVMHSLAAADRRERSEIAAEVIGRYIERIEETRVVGYSDAPPFNSAVILRRAFAMVSHVSSVSTSASESRESASCSPKAVSE
jgi:hypothetical protein